MRFYVCVHHSTGPASTAITLATEAIMRGPWTFGGERPATHAFVAAELEGVRWRLDGEPGGAHWRPLDAWPSVPQTAAWELVTSDPAPLLRRARSLDGTPYDWAEIADQGVAAADALLPRFPWRVRWGSRPGLEHAAICTRIAQLVLGAAAQRISDAVRAMPDLLPERFSRVMLDAEADGHARRVV